MRGEDNHWQAADGGQRGPSTFDEYRAAVESGETHAKCLVFARGVTPDEAWVVLGAAPPELRGAVARRVRFDPGLARSRSASDAVGRTSPSKTRAAARADLAAAASPLRGRVRATRRRAA